MDRTYEAALARLASLQSNQAVTSLFSTPAPAPVSAPAPAAASNNNGNNNKTQDLNALAIPEMLTWARRAGLDPQHDFGSGSGSGSGSEGGGGRRLRCIHVSGTKGKGSVCAFLTSILTHKFPAAVAAAEDGGGGGTGRKRVGTYTSPHLVSVRERILLDGAPIGREAFARYFFEVWDRFTEAGRAEVLASSSSASSTTSTTSTSSYLLPPGLTEQEIEELLQGPATKPFYFRFLTILAFHVFLREGVETAVVECGIGAEYDPTNGMLVDSKAVTASVVAQLGIDHVAMLGATVPEIAWHKAGVCKFGRRCFTRKLEEGSGEGERVGEGQGEAEKTMQVLRRRAAEKGAELVEIDDAAVRAWGGVRGGDDETSLGGAFQVFNQALAVCAAREHLRVLKEEEEEEEKEKKGEPSSILKQLKSLADPKTSEAWLSDLPPEFAQGLRKARLRGRCETLVDSNAGITWLVDGAHTAESLEEVARWFTGKLKQKQQKQKQKRVLIFNQQERDAAKMLRRLVGNIERFSAVVGGEGEGGGGSPFDLAIFTRNDMLPGNNGPGEPERDLSVQRAAADAMREVSPGTERVLVVDNVSEAVEMVKGSDEEEKGEVVVLVTGSLHLVGAVLRTLEPDAEA